MSPLFEAFFGLAASIVLWSFALVVWDVSRAARSASTRGRGTIPAVASILAALAGSIVLFFTLPQTGLLELGLSLATILTAFGVDYLVGDYVRDALGLNA